MTRHHSDRKTIQGGEHMKKDLILPLVALIFSSFSLGVALTALIVK